MKKLISINLYKACVWCLIGALGFTLSSCIEEGENEVDGKGSNFIRIIAETDADSEMNIGPAAFEAVPNTATFLELRRDAVSNAALNEAITVSVALDNTLVDAYNAYVDEYNDYVAEFNSDLDSDDDGIDDIDALDEKAHYIILEPERYSIGETTVTFAPGEFAKFIPMTLDPTGAASGIGYMDFTAQYGVGVKITSSPSNYSITSAGNNVIVNILVKNKYDGKYKVEGELFNHPSVAGPIASPGLELVTAGGNQLTFYAPYGEAGAYFTGVNMTMTIDEATNKVTMVETPGFAALVYQDLNYNRYDPVEKKFYLKFGWGVRVIEAVFTYAGAR